MIDLENKKVAVLGLGRENLPLVHFLVKKKAEVTVCDKREDLGFREKDLGIKEWRLGPDYLKNLTDFEIVFRTPGLYRLTPRLVEAEKKGVEISSATKLFFDLCPARIIGVTGTKGKGTTAALIFEILCSAGLARHLPVRVGAPTPGDPSSSDLVSESEPPDVLGNASHPPASKVYLAGNIGNPAISIIEKLQPCDWVILELSSFQLQDLEKSPHIAVILNITSDHLDYHKSQREYQKAKENIVRYQTKRDFAVINLDYFTSFRFAALTKGKVFWFSRRKSVDQGCFVRWTTIKNGRRFGRIGEVILRTDGKDYLVCPTYEIDLIGLHNLENICAATVASYLAGAKIKDIQKVVTTFKGLEHRLELVAEINGVKYVNDSFSTTPETTIAALQSFSEPVILICGGRSKGGDYSKLVKEIKNSSVKVVILIGEISAALNSKLKTKNVKPQFKIQNLGFATMDKIVKVAKKEARPGDVVLFSPGCASFDMFKNASDRGRQFKEEVKKYG